MPFPLKAAGLTIIAALWSVPFALAQTRDSVGVGSAVADSSSAADSLLPPPLGGVGSLSRYGMPVETLPDTALKFTLFRTTGDLIGESDGIFVAGTGLGGYRRKFSVNGLRDGSIAFMADGLLLNDPSTGLYLAGLYPVDFAGTVEFAPSPGAFAGAFGAAGGAVNFVSRSPRARHAVSRIRYTQSSYGWSTFDGSLWQDVAKGVNVTLGMQHPTSDGRFINSAMDAWNGRMKVRYDVDDAAVYVSDFFNRWQRGLDGGVSLATPESLRYEPIRALVVDPSATEYLVRHDLVAGASFGRDSADMTGIDVQFTSAFRQYIDEPGGTGVRDTREEQTSGFRVAHSHTIAGSTLALSAEMRNRRLLRDPNIGAHRSVQSGVSGLLALRFAPSLTLTPAARYDNYLDVGRLSVGTDLEFRPGGTFTLRGGVSRSHRFPSFAEAYGVQGLALPLTSAGPERHDVISAGVSGGDQTGTHVSLTVFHRRIDDPIILDSSGSAAGAPLAYVRTPAETRSGASLSATARAGSILAEVSADYLSYGGGARRRYAPTWEIGAGVYFRDRVVGGHLDLKAGLRGRYFTGYDGEAYAQRYELFLPSGMTIPPAGTIDLVLFAGIGDAVIHLIWENFLNRNYVMTVFYPADDRAIRFGLAWNFLD